MAFDGVNNPEVVDNGLVYDTDDFVAAHSDVIDMAYMGAKYKDKFWKAFPEEISGFGAVYSKELLAEIGFDGFPRTWDELLEAGEAVKAQGKVLTTLHAYWPPLFGFIQQSTEAGRQASIEGDWDSPTWVESMRYFEALVPYLGPDEFEMSDAVAPLRVVDGEMLFYIDGQWMLYEAAAIDGASTWQVFWWVMLPLVSPALATMGIFSFLYTWGDFMLPIMLARSDELFTVAVGALFLTVAGRGTTDPTLVAAGLLISIVPVLIIYLLMQRYVLQGLTSGAVKGIG